MPEVTAGTLFELGVLFIFASASLVVESHDAREASLSSRRSRIVDLDVDNEAEFKPPIPALKGHNNDSDLHLASPTTVSSDKSSVAASSTASPHAKVHYPPYSSAEYDWSRDAHVDRIQDLPIETLQQILEPACISKPRTYYSLVLTSRHIASVTVDHCLPLIPVLIHTTEALLSFEALVHGSPNTATRVRHVWIMPPLSRWASEQRCGAILSSCPGVTDLACGWHTLHALVSAPNFVHTACTRLTVLDPMLAARDLAFTPHGMRFCAQLTHLRWPGPAQNAGFFMMLRFSRLTHLCLSPHHDWLKPIQHHGRTTSVLVPLLSKPSLFEALQKVVITEAASVRRSPFRLHWDKRTISEEDGRISFLFCRQTWKESQAWRAEVLGRRNTIWS